MQTPVIQLEAYFAGNASAQQLRALEAWINADPAHARAFMEQLHLRETIAQHLREQANNTGCILSELAHAQAQTTPTPGPGPAASAARATTRATNRPTSNTTRRDPDALTAGDFAYALGYFLAKGLTSRPAQKAYAYAATALILAAALWLIPWDGTTPTAQTTPYNPTAPAHPTPPGPDTQPAHPVATLTNTHHAQWGGAASAAPTTGDTLYPNARLTLTQGFAEVTTHRGAIAILEAPATIEFTESDNALRLHTGKLVGLCHTDSSKGFVVKTDHATITDLGTEFGVEARADGVDTTVFVGSVEVATPGGDVQPITASQTARITVVDDRHELVVEDALAQGFAQRMPRAALIADARINRQGYRIKVVQQGVYEDVKVFTDREHELNGIDASGIPAVLLDGDLVMMPADPSDFDPDIASVQVELDLTRPTDIYLLLGPDVTPDWLTRDYELTNLSVGLDRGGRRGEELGIGPGQDVEQPLVVWQRKQTESAGTVVVGRGIKDNMFVIIAAPAPTNEP